MPRRRPLSNKSQAPHCASRSFGLEYVAVSEAANPAQPRPACADLRRNVLHVARLNLVNFRNSRHLELALPPHLVIIQGDNAQGKTNLLESIHVIATTKSHRASSDRDLLNSDATAEDLPFARLTADVERAGGHLDVEIVMRLERGQ